MENWIETASGRTYHFNDPQPDEIEITDIAMALANKCRFSGHTQYFSVAEHSVCVAYRLPAHLRLAGLLHDAAEAYLGDIPSPIKYVLPDYCLLEKINEQAVFEKFGIAGTMKDFKKEIKDADLRALFTEAYYLLPSKAKTWSYFQEGTWNPEPEYKPQCLPPVFAYAEFMKAYEEFTGVEKPRIILPGAFLDNA